MQNRFSALLLLCSIWIAAGCAAVVAGAGAGAGVYTYMNGELKRTYQAGYQEVRKAADASLNDLKIVKSDEKSDGIETEIAAKRSDGTSVTLHLTKLGPNLTEVAVRSGIVGVWDKEVSELIHATIAKKL
jgi:hypothetical protein